MDRGGHETLEFQQGLEAMDRLAGGLANHERTAGLALFHDHPFK
jgi:hypothetical protein